MIDEETKVDVVPGKKVSISKIIGILMIVHSLSGSALTFLKNPYGSDLNTAVVEFLGGYGFLRAKKNSERNAAAIKDLEEKVNNDPLS